MLKPKNPLFTGKNILITIVIQSENATFSNEVQIQINFITTPICEAAAEDLKLMTMQSYEFDVQENCKTPLKLGPVSSIFALLQRCQRPLEVICRITKGIKKGKIWLI